MHPVELVEVEFGDRLEDHGACGVHDHVDTAERQSAHLDSRRLNLPPDDPRTPLIWRIRVDDLKRTLDQLDLLESSVPGLAGRLDHTRIAVAGHSWGAQTASMLP